MKSIRQKAREAANNFSRVIKEKAQIHLDEVVLKVETQARVLKQSIIGVSKTPSNVERSQPSERESLKQKAPSTVPLGPSKSHHVATGRIEKHRHDASNKKLKVFLARQKEAEEFERRKAENSVRRWRLQEEKEAKRREEYAAWLENKDKQSLLPAPATRPSPEPPKQVPVVSESHEERRQFISDRLTAILGPERMKMPAFIASGNNPIDPVIAGHNLEQYQNTVLDAWEAKNDAERREAEQIQANRQQILSKVSYYRDRYLVRLEKLVSFGTQLAEAIDLLEIVLYPLNEYDAAVVVHAITWELLSPIQDLLNDCSNEIPLEETGAKELRNAWPMERMDQLFDFLNHQCQLPGAIIEMGHRLTAILHAVYKPTPFDDPLNPKPKPFTFCSCQPFCPAPPKPKDTSQPPAGTITAVPGSGLDKLIAATAEKAKENSKNPPAGTTSVLPGNSLSQEQKDVHRAAVLKHVSTNHMELMDQVGELVNHRDDKVSSYRRRQIETLFRAILDDANGCKGLLENNEGTTYREQIKLCAHQLEMLSMAETKIPANRKLRRMCDEVMKLWK